jgi:hypothetical protein
MDYKESFIRSYCSSVYDINGQACIIIGGLEDAQSLKPGTKVPVFDLDSGDITKETLIRLVKTPIYRASNESDYTRQGVLNSKWSNEVQEIIGVLFDV